MTSMRRVLPTNLILVIAVFVSSLAWGDETPSGGPPGVPPESGQAGSLDAITQDDGPRFRVNSFVLQYAHDHPDHPRPDVILDRRVDLGLTDEGYVKPRAGVPVVSVNIGEVDQLEQHLFFASAIRTISESVVVALHERGLIGIHVEPDTRDIDRIGRDLRPEGQEDLRLFVRTAFVTKSRTIASGDRVATESRIDDERHERILRMSPLRHASSGQAGDLLRKDVLDDFLHRLNRHPGRRVDVSIAAGPDKEQGGVALDYLVSENKPWLVYGQVSNTGTEDSKEHRLRMGFVHHQMTDGDDIFRFDYITAGFDDANAVTGSYEAPVGESEFYRWRTYGAWSDFTAGDIALEDRGLTGESWLVGGELVFNAYQDGPFFLDLVGGGAVRTHLDQQPGTRRD